MLDRVVSRLREETARSSRITDFEYKIYKNKIDHNAQ